MYQRRDRLHFAVFSLLGLHFLAFWPCGPSFPCILALSAFISLHFGLVGLTFLSFWSCRPSFPFILAFWAFISFHFSFVGLLGPLFSFILAFWAFISLHFGVLGLHFLSFSPFPFGFLGLGFLSFSCQGRGFPYLLVFWWRSLQLCLLTLVSTGLTALPAMDAQAHACKTSGTASPSPPQWWEDAAGVSHAPAPVLHREGLFGRTPTD